MLRRALALLLLSAGAAAVVSGAEPPPAQAALAPAGSPPLARRKPRSATCKKERIQPFLVRSSFVKQRRLQPEEHRRALRFRVEEYGRLPGVPFEKLNPVGAAAQAVDTTFMGLPLRIHARVAPSLACVEKRLRARCSKGKNRYVPRAIGGLREANTYRGGEVSNHLFGLAIDIDPERNPCCGCVAPWPDHPSCKKEADSIWERTELPRCWVEAFEHHGFYWLGRDQLEDTMHFEYLADPDR